MSRCRDGEKASLPSVGSLPSLVHNDLTKSIMSLRRLYLCFCDLVDLLKSCAETEDVVKKKSIYQQMESSIGLIRVRSVFGKS